MRSSVLARSRVLSACVLAGVAALLGGCAAAASTSSISGKNLVVYVSPPAGGAGGQEAQDVVNAERLAFHQFSGRVGSYTVSLEVLNGGRLSDNARTAIEDASAIAYLGEVLPGQSADSLGITNDQDLLQVSPTDTALELTQATTAVPSAPDVYYEALSSNGRTFARVVPTTSLEAKALVDEMHAAHVHKLYVADDGQPYGAALALAVRQDAGSALSAVAGPPTASGFAASGADAMFLASSSPGSATGVFDAVAAKAPATGLYAPSALDQQSFAASLTPAAARNLRVSSPGFLPADLTPAGHKFVSAFESDYGHAPAPEGIFGYAAMQTVIDVLQEAGDAAGTRSTVVKDFFGLKNHNSVLGPFTIDANGDTNLAPFVLSRVTAGRLVPYRFVQVQG